LPSMMIATWRGPLTVIVLCTIKHPLRKMAP
jgi:hypothetical protein